MSSTTTEQLIEEVANAVAHIREATRTREFSCVHDRGELSEIFSHGNDMRSSIVETLKLSQKADWELHEWYDISNVCQYECDFVPRMNEWLNAVTDQELADLLHKTPSGGRGLQFTPFQRLYMAFLCFRPFPVTSRACVDESDYERLRSVSRKRTRIVQACSSVSPGVLDFNILNLKTGNGKTSICLSVAIMLATVFFDQTHKKYTDHLSYGVHNCKLENRLARLIVVTSAGGVFSHWRNEFARLQTEFLRLANGRTIVLWNGSSKHYSTQAAVNLEGDPVVVWFLQLSKLNEEMRSHPQHAVLCVVTDEMTVDTPTEKFVSFQSPVVCRLLPQATPHALVAASQGYTSWMQRQFGGPLLSPSELKGFIELRDTRSIQTLLVQRCHFDHWMPGWFRDHIDEDLRKLTPKGIQVIDLLSKRGTLGSHLRNVMEDLVPCNMRNIVLHRLHYVTDSTYQRVNAIFDSPAFEVSHLLNLLTTERDKSGNPITSQPDISRLIERIEEFCTECPICFEKTTDMSILNCCSYCVCTSCFQRMSRCAFCRTTVSSDMAVPGPTSIPEVVAIADDVFHTIALHAKKTNLQMKNLVFTLLSLVTHGHRRILLLVDLSFVHWGNQDAIQKTVDTIFELTGIRDIVYAENLMNGKGTRFEGLKAKFDDLRGHPDPMVLLCNNASNSKTLVGVDFTMADSIVVMGKIHSAICTQILGRILRPNPKRDNQKPIPFVKIFCRR